MIGASELAEAARNTDALAEELGRGIYRTVDVEPEGLYYVAKQRAIRAVLAATGRLGEMSPREYTSHRFTNAEHEQIERMAVVWVDGVMVGLRLGREARHG